MFGDWGGGWGLEGDFGQREMVNARARETMIWMSAMRFRMGTDESAEQEHIASEDEKDEGACGSGEFMRARMRMLTMMIVSENIALHPFFRFLHHGLVWVCVLFSTLVALSNSASIALSVQCHIPFVVDDVVCRRSRGVPIARALACGCGRAPPIEARSASSVAA